MNRFVLTTALLLAGALPATAQAPGSGTAAEAPPNAAKVIELVEKAGSPAKAAKALRIAKIDGATAHRLLTDVHIVFTEYPLKNLDHACGQVFIVVQGWCAF